jgi:hypothetical protein
MAPLSLGERGGGVRAFDVLALRDVIIDSVVP